MAQNSKIEWTDATWNPITGCSIASPGCTNCYAMQMAGTRLKSHPSREGLTKLVNGNHVWTGEVRFNEKWLTQPLHWRKPRMIFVCAHGDLFHEDVPDKWIDQVFAVMALCPQHTFQVLTKRPARMREYLVASRASLVGMAALDLTITATFKKTLSKIGEGVILTGDIAHLENWPLPNVWLGTSIENQQTADDRIPDLLATPAAIRFISAEPLLGPVNLTGLNWGNRSKLDVLQSYVSFPTGAPGTYSHYPADDIPAIDWVIVGGESGPKARPMHHDWARNLRDQCSDAEVPFFFKQWGSWKFLGRAGDEAAQDDYIDLSTDRNFQPIQGKGAILDIDGYDWSNDQCQHPSDCALLANVGKTSAGRLLDGVEHNAMPEVSK